MVHQILKAHMDHKERKVYVELGVDLKLQGPKGLQWNLSTKDTHGSGF